VSNCIRCKKSFRQRLPPPVTIEAHG
jgi:hypothetical protein